MKTAKILSFALFAMLFAAGCRGVEGEDPDNNGGNGGNNGGNGGNTQSSYVEDPQPGNTAFVHRSLLVDITGIWCQYCPWMAASMKQLEDDPAWSKRLVMAALHSGDELQPSGLTTASIQSAFEVEGYPTMNIDFRNTFANMSSGSAPNNNVNYIKNNVEQFHNTAAKAGISARVERVANKIKVFASVKAAETGRYNLGAWVVEDGVKANQKQANSTGLTGDFDTHNHVVRIMDSKVSNLDYTGHSLGSIEKGQTVNREFSWEIPDNWDRTNCSVILFVTTPGSNGRNYVTNAVRFSAGNHPFEYEK